MKLRLKILSGFLILALMLTVAAVWSVFELRSIGTSVNLLLEENYKSIAASKTMIEALEREDSGVLLLMLGKWDEGRKIISSGDSLFQEGFNIAASNITIENEQSYIDSINRRYKEYQNMLAKPIVGTTKEGDINWYFREVHTAFLKVKSAVNDLMDINDDTMYSTASGLRNKANRAVMPAIVAIIAALVFTFMFNFFVNYYFVNPIVRITSGIKDFIKRLTPFNVKVDTKDELAELTSSIHTLCSLSKRSENTDEA